MLLPTAITPGTPRFIIPGVMKKAPPLPMNPLRMPPTNPNSTTWSAFARSRTMKSFQSSSGILHLAHSIFTSLSSDFARFP